MEVEDAFGGVSMLFDEFEKDRDSSTFISFDRTNDGKEDRGKIVFTNNGLDEEATDDESENERTVDVGLSECDDSMIIPKGMFNESETKEIKCENDSKFKLTHEKNKFQRFASIIDSTRYVHDEESPGCQIIFQNNRFSRKYRPEIEKFIFRLMEMDSRDSEVLPDLKLKASTPTCVDINGKLDSSMRTSEMWEAHAIIGASQFHRECMIDRFGFPLTGHDTSLTYGWEVPAYEQVFVEALPTDDSEKPTKPERMKQSCFNCGGNHRINECTEPKNFQRIRENKNKFMQQQSQKQGTQRYHVEGEVDPRFASFKPGIMSRDLRKALDISSKEIPLHIYHMRQLGYPPGWMQEALLQDSGISIFDKDGNEVLVTGEMMEDGEIKDRLPNEGQIDPEKIIEYPGFTVDPPEGVLDEYEKYGSIPMQTCQLVSTLKKDLKDLTESRKRKLEEERKSNKKNKTMESNDTDMDIVEESPSKSVNGHVFVPPLPVDTPPSRPPLPKDHSSPAPLTPKLSLPMTREISTTDSERSESPSLEELESQLKLLQDKLASNETDVDLQILDSCGASDEENSPEVAELLMLKEKLLKRTDSISSIQTFGELGSGGSCPSTPQPNTNTSINSIGILHQSKSISKDYGTPILKGPIESLPDSSKFGEGIEDHIPYENLPDATGTYDKIRELISRVRTIKSKKKKNQ